MDLGKGVYTALKKDGSQYYRSSITYKNKHISLGSFASETSAHNCYLEANNLLTSELTITDFTLQKRLLSFDKWVSIINFRDNSIYFKNPIYLHSKYFSYYYDDNTEYKFDVDDLFFYSNHKIMKRGSHLFVAEYGMQTNILSRYGIKSYAVAGRDYMFINGDSSDFRYKNIQIINRYYGVIKSEKKGRAIYTSRILINGQYIIGRYCDEIDAAIAYNKAAELLISRGILNTYQKNYIEHISSIEYARRYNSVKISTKLRNLSSI